MSLLRPHITEKSYAGVSEDKSRASTYTFLVPATLDKATIIRMVEKEFSVTVEDVRTVNLPGKARRFKNIQGRTAKRCKALVRVKKGERIAAFDIESKDKSVDKQ